MKKASFPPYKLGTIHQKKPADSEFVGVHFRLLPGIPPLPVQTDFERFLANVARVRTCASVTGLAAQNRRCTITESQARKALENRLDQPSAIKYSDRAQNQGAFHKSCNTFAESFQQRIVIKVRRIVLRGRRTSWAVQ
jgi:hypothetical protein